MLFFGPALLLASAPIAAPKDTPTALVWQKLPTEPYRGKQDDVHFVNPEVGWYVNGAGRIYKTTDGGKTWNKQLDKPGTYFRCVCFLDEKHGFAGNIGPDYFPGVTDTTALYETRDGGTTWAAVTNIKGPKATGLCAIEVVRTPFINEGQLDEKRTLWAGGRVGGPAFLLHSSDAGASWESTDLSSQCGMILDIKFISAKVGFLCAASDRDVAKSHALILMTRDGGKTWQKKYESSRPYELTWKGAFPSEKVGYVTIQSYNPDKSVSQRYLAKTADGGETWVELPLINDASVRTFGVAFADEKLGWVGGLQTSFQTSDGGKSWSPVTMGTAVNKIRLLPTPTGLVGYAIGVDLYKLVFIRDKGAP